MSMNTRETTEEKIPVRVITRPKRKSRQESGATIIIFALMSSLMIGIVGFGADVGNWYWVGAQEQKAVDAAALAAVTQLPGPITGNVSDIANSSLSKNGFGTDPNTINTVEAVAGSSTQIRVVSTRKVKTYFASIFGLKTVDVKKSARAEYRGSVAMGNPTAVFGNDPDGTTGSTNYPNHWLVAGGPDEQKQNGDRYLTNYCGATAYWCNSSSGNNAEKRPDGEFFAIEVSPAAAARADPLNIEVYDGIFGYSGDAVCSGGYPSGGFTTTQMNSWGVPSNDTTRYAAGSTASPNKWCTGEQVARTTTYLTTSFTTYNPMTQANVPMSGGVACAQRDFHGYNISASGTIQTLLSGTSASATEFKQSFHRWKTICTISAKVAGTYILQLNTSGGSGNNVFSLRASTGVTDSGSRNESGVSIAAMDRFVIYANKPASGTSAVTASFYLARVPPGAAGSNLLLSFYDIGDSSGTITIQPLAPAEATGTGISTSGGLKQFGGGAGAPCSFALYSATGNNLDSTRTRTVSLTNSSATCTFSGLTSTAGYQGGLVEITVPIPSDYTCDLTSPTGCWVKLQMTFPAGTSPTDVTSWEAVLQRKLVRLLNDNP
jgi:Flp pilus assembly protein TadG